MYILGTDNGETLDGTPDADTIEARGGDDTVNADEGDDIVLAGLGKDLIYGQAGNDGLYFGAYFDFLDLADGGAGANDQLGLQGNYGASGTPLTLSAGNMVDIELMALLSGSNTDFGDTGGQLYDYYLTTDDANVAAGRRLIVSFNQLLAGEDVGFDGSAETDGYFLTYGGEGADRVTGSQLDDGFFFGGNRWGASDAVSGQAGLNDQLGLQGNYSGAEAITFGASQLTGVEALVMLSGSDTRFGSAGSSYSYDVTLHDGNVAVGERMFVVANGLTADETLTFDGSAEADGHLFVFSGAADDEIHGGGAADELYGGGGNDVLHGGGGGTVRDGGDRMTGGEGDDTFLYTSIDEASPNAINYIWDFTQGDDRIDLSAIDANTATPANDAFSFIGTAAFSGAPGELRIFARGSLSSPHWVVQGNVDGVAGENGYTDFNMLVYGTGLTPLTGSDFVL
ncbi:MAG TPA: M10 family metallopeptidase C-terminal domain-containing protein [Croceibacterium sp.]|nr:M10 family metallopeptidase C-terminal domain-containing protein [Croceibacterium sp.]